MINNRQQNGRRRGRGGQRSQGGNPGRPDTGNRIDNRARGNANQLYEKYKTLARDAQMQGDRVNTEYYLQFADHYFRVLGESRSRFEERRPREDSFDEDGDEYGDEGEPARADQYQPQPERDGRRERRQNNGNGGANGSGDGAASGATAPVAAEGHQPAGVEASSEPSVDDGENKPRRRGRPRRERVAEPAGEVASEGLDADRLPPSLSLSASSDGPEKPEGDPDAKPRRRRRTAAAAADGVEAGQAG